MSTMVDPLPARARCASAAVEKWREGAIERGRGEERESDK
jgi:hypothetical protein